MPVRPLILTFFFCALGIASCVQPIQNPIPTAVAARLTEAAEVTSTAILPRLTSPALTSTAIPPPSTSTALANTAQLPTSTPPNEAHCGIGLLDHNVGVWLQGQDAVQVCAAITTM